MTRPIYQILPKENNEDITILLKNFARTIDEYVNFGTHILQWIVKVKNSGDDKVPLILLLRDLLEKADAISILVEKGSSEPAKVLLRGVFEIYLYIGYLTKENQVDRNMSFIVCDNKARIKRLEKYKQGNPHNKNLQRQIEKDKNLIDKDILKKLPSESIELEIQKIQDLLNSDDYLKANTEYENRKANRKRLNWYSLFNGPNSLEELAQELDSPFIYDTMYRELSRSTHCIDIIDGKVAESKSSFPDDESKCHFSINQIRLPKDIQYVVTSTSIYLVKIFEFVIKERIPERESELKNWFSKVKPTLDTLTSGEEFLKIN